MISIFNPPHIQAAKIHRGTVFNQAMLAGDTKPIATAKANKAYILFMSNNLAFDAIHAEMNIRERVVEVTLLFEL